MTITANVTQPSSILFNLAYSANGGVSYLPASNMTSNSLPSPLVALADSEASGAYAAFCAFDEITFPASPATLWFSDGVVPPHWLQIDLGVGNGIRPNRVKMQTYQGYEPQDFNVAGSATGAFTGEEVTLLTVTGETGKVHAAVTTYTIP